MDEPTEAQLGTLTSLPIDAPVAALNLFCFNTRARYQPEDPEHGTPEEDVSGREAYERYIAAVGPFIERLGGRVVFSAPVDQVMIGPGEPAWDLAAVMYFPTRGAFLQMVSDSDFQHASRHRRAALANHYMLHLTGDPFTS